MPAVGTPGQPGYVAAHSVRPTADSFGNQAIGFPTGYKSYGGSPCAVDYIGGGVIIREPGGLAGCYAPATPAIGDYYTQDEFNIGTGDGHYLNFGLIVQRETLAGGEYGTSVRVGPKIDGPQGGNSSQGGSFQGTVGYNEASNIGSVCLNGYNIHTGFCVMGNGTAVVQPLGLTGDINGLLIGQQPGGYIAGLGFYGNGYQHPLLDIENSATVGGALASMLSLDPLGNLSNAGTFKPGSDVILAPGKSVTLSDATTGVSTYIHQNPNGVVQLNNSATAAGTIPWTPIEVGGVISHGPILMQQYTLVTLPTNCTVGELAYATDVRKAGEAAGAGSGDAVLCSPPAKGAANTWLAVAGALATN